jgi:gamma-glutamyl hydrolase
MQLNYFIILLIACASIERSHAQNNQPVIGILTTTSDIKTVFNPESWSYLPGSYISFIESAGARVIPIPFDAPYENLTYFFNRINGLLLPGGGANLWIDTPQNNSRVPANVTAAGFYLLNLAKEVNDKGGYFPVWATCQGFEIFMMWASNDLFVLDNITDTNIARNVSFTFDSTKSQLWSQVPTNIKQAMTTEALTFYNHQNMVSPEKFFSNSELMAQYSINAIAYGAAGRWFIASLEHKKYPFYANQFHPEKDVFEWQPQISAPHTPIAILFEQSLANYFVNQARMNANSFNKYAALNASLIYNFRTYAPGPTHDFSFIYFFAYVNQTPSFWPNLFNSSLIDSNNEAFT